MGKENACPLCSSVATSLIISSIVESITPSLRHWKYQSQIKPTTFSSFVSLKSQYPYCSLYKGLQWVPS
ncbi:TPA: hypothetical protein ACT9JI_003116 [Legionella pneumophila]